MKSKGMVYLVGAGPGDPGLFTLRGAELLGRAEVVIYDGLVNPALLRLAKPEAEILYGGKHDRTRCVSQEELNALLLAKAGEGKMVVRLKGGDPYVFARGGEEAEVLAKAKIRFEVVPGVSSVEAAPNYAGIPLTHRRFCSSYTVVTGHHDPAKLDDTVDWASLARTPGTLVILMGLRNLREITHRLAANGRSPETPAAVIRWATLGRQQVVEATLGTLAEAVAQAHLEPPAVTIIGEVVKLRSQLDWFSRRPLLGQRIVVTRARDQAAQLGQPLQERGAEVLEIPCIKFGLPKEREPVIEALSGLHSYDWIIFTSANGVNRFFDMFFHGFQDMRDIGGVRIAAVGPATAARLRDLHLQVDAMPKEYIASAVAKALADFESLDNRRILLLRAEVANPELPKLLEDFGAIVDDIACYQTLPEIEDFSGDAARFRETGADWITFTSGSTVEHFHTRFNLPQMARQFPGLQFASIGPETTKAMAALGCKPAIEAKPHTVEGLIEGLEKYLAKTAKVE